MVKRVNTKTKYNILKILNTLRKAHRAGELLTVNRIAKSTGMHKWSVSRTLDLYMSPYVSVRIIEELEALGMNAKIISLAKPDITDEQALRVLSVRI